MVVGGYVGQLYQWVVVIDENYWFVEIVVQCQCVFIVDGEKEKVGYVFVFKCGLEVFDVVFCVGNWMCDDFDVQCFGVLVKFLQNLCGELVVYIVDYCNVVCCQDDFLVVYGGGYVVVQCFGYVYDLCVNFGVYVFFICQCL